MARCRRDTPTTSCSCGSCEARGVVAGARGSSTQEGGGGMLAESRSSGATAGKRPDCSSLSPASHLPPCRNTTAPEFAALLNRLILFGDLNQNATAGLLKGTELAPSSGNSGSSTPDGWVGGWVGHQGAVCAPCCVLPAWTQPPALLCRHLAAFIHRWSPPAGMCSSRATAARRLPGCSSQGW